MKYAILPLLLLACLTFSCSPTNPTAELMDAHKLMLNLKHEAALPKIERCLAIDPQNIDATILDAICIYSLKNADPKQRKNARLNLARILPNAPKRFDLLYTYTWVLLQDKAYDDAINAARQARMLYRSLQQPPIPPNPNCDTLDIQLAKANSSYANLLLMMADTCAHNALVEGLPYFSAILSTRAVNFPELHQEYARLFYVNGYTTNAYKVLKNAVVRFPKNLPCAYNFAFIDLDRRKNLKLTREQNESLKDNFRRALKLAEEYDDKAVKARITEHIIHLQ